MTSELLACSSDSATRRRGAHRTVVAEKQPLEFRHCAKPIRRSVSTPSACRRIRRVPTSRANP
ncbi:hypothetical protein HMPREF3193_00762 [Bifidobacterium breve]|nr:hypothetical protein HMPREF3193_00762 [Bifidobacterium breve]